MRLYNLLIALVLIVVYHNTLAQIKLQEINLANNSKIDKSRYFNDEIYYVVVNADDASNLSNYIETYIGNHQYLLAVPTNYFALIKNKIYSVVPKSKILSDVNLDDNISSVQIQFASSISKENVFNIIQQYNGKVNEIINSENTYKITIATQQLQKIAELPYVLMIAKDYKHKQALVSDSYLLDRLPKVNAPTPNGFGLNGEGISIGIWDEGIIGSHINLESNRIFNVDKDYNFSSHPTQVAGAAAMAGNTNYTNKGAASKAKIYAWDLLGDIIQEIKNGANQFGVSVTNHSYNFEQTKCKTASGLYTPDASRLDKLAYEYPNVVHVIASGNTAHTCAVNDTFYSMDIGYQGSKNGITVGYLYNTEKLVETSGSGPTTDGRLKPELVAKGFGYAASVPGNGFSTVYGSSFSAPQIAGIASLVQQQYKLQNGVLPPSSLVKAVLCNTAEDMYLKGIDYRAGFGRPDATKAIKNIKDNHFFIGDVNHQQNKTHQFSITQPNEFLSIALSWTDKQSFVLQDRVLVNNLDLKLITPSGDTILPWVLDPINYKAPAKRGIDNLNNIEYISIDSAVVGTYTIIVNGFDIPTTSQTYALSYMHEPNGVDIVYPDGGETIEAGNSSNIIWNSRNITDSLVFSYSIDGGLSWDTIAKVPNSAAFLTWTPPSNITSNQALIRAQTPTLTNTSDNVFSIITRPNAASIVASACDRTITLNWPAITNAQFYTVYLFDGLDWKKVDTTSKLYNIISSLENGKQYAVALSVTIGGIESNKSTAKTVIPNFVACTNLNDIGVYSISRPKVGRQFTSMQLGNNDTLFFVIKNFGSNAVSNFNLSYKINNGSYSNLLVNRTVNSNDTIVVSVNVGSNFSAIGNYTITAYASFISDMINTNDTLVYKLKHLANLPINLPWSESFESVDTIITFSTFGIDNLDYTDFSTQKNGRWRVRNSDFAKSGQHAITLDNFANSGSVSNEHIMTFNLSNYVDSVIYFDFSYMHHGEVSGLDFVLARGSDTSNWIPIYDLFTARKSAGVYNDVKAINLYRLLSVENGQPFSSSTQIKFLTTSTNSSNEFAKNGGYTFDDLKLYVANNDFANYTVDSTIVICLNEPKSIPVTIKVSNQSNQSKSNLKLAYAINNGSKVSETILQTIAPMETFEYTFTHTLPITQAGRFELRTFIDEPNDEYRLNDTSNVIPIIVNTYINTLPYINNFEQNALFIPNGQNSSWTWSEPQKSYTRYAAQGKKAWTNSTFDAYNYNEFSELYAGCYNFQSLSSKLSLAFNQLQNIETLYDSVWAEFSLNGSDWNRLGCANCGANFYNNTNGKNKWDRTLMPWQVASTEFNFAPTDDKSTVFVRFRLSSDVGTVAEGLAVDDWHVYASNKGIAPSDSTYINVVSNGTGWISIEKNGLLIAELFDDHKNLGNIEFGYCTSNTVQNLDERVVLPRNWSVKVQNNLIGNFKIRWYILNDEYLKLLQYDANLFSMRDIAALRYNGFNQDLDIYNNNINGQFDIIHQDSLYFVPYKNGYYVEMPTTKFGEFYLIGKDKKPTLSESTKFISFDAQQLNDDAFLSWEIFKDSTVRSYFIQLSLDGVNFLTIDSLPSSQNATDTSLYNFIHSINAHNGTVLYYRIGANLLNGKSILSLVDSIYFDIPTGIKQQTFTVKAYFNQQTLHIENSKLHGDAHLLLSQLDGQLIHQQTIEFVNGKASLEINKNLLSNTIYIVKLQSGNTIFVSKIFKK